jgi:hypothetical protein
MSIEEQSPSEALDEQTESGPGEVEGSKEPNVVTTSAQNIQVETQSNAPSENPPAVHDQASAAQELAIHKARIHCHKCKLENPPTALRCQNCGANLLPAEGIGQRLASFVGLLAGSVFLGYLFYRFYIQLPGSAPDIILCNVGALAGGAIASFVMAFVLLLRKTPPYVKYENRAKRHVSLNAWQALDDFNRAMDLAEDKEQGNLIKQRVEVYKKLGLTEEAERDYLALATSPGAYKGAGEWIAALTGADAETISSGVSSSQNAILLQSGKAKAVGYCEQCGDAVVLNNDLRCQTHPKKKVKEVEFVIPSDVLVGKLTVLQKMEPRSKKLSAKIIELLGSGKARAIGYCKRCKAVVQLDSSRQCTTHPNVKGQYVQFVIPGNEAEKKRAILRWRRDDLVAGRRRNLVIISLIFMAFALYVIFGRGFWIS